MPFSTMVSLLFRRLNFDFSLATIDGKPLKDLFDLLNYCAFDLETSLVLFKKCFSDYYVGTGVKNFEQSTAVIGRSIRILNGFDGFDRARFCPKSFPANLEDDLLLKIYTDFERILFNVKADGQKQLQATQLDMLSSRSFATVDGRFAYSVERRLGHDEGQTTISSVEFIKESFGTGELSTCPTINWKTIDFLVRFLVLHIFICTFIGIVSVVVVLEIDFSLLFQIRPTKVNFSR